MNTLFPDNFILCQKPGKEAVLIPYTAEKCMEIARRFEQLCEERGTTPYKIARYSGLSSSTVSYFLAGKTVPRIDTVMILCNQLGVTVTDIFDERGMAEVHAQDEELVLYTYRNLPEDKKKKK